MMKRALLALYLVFAALPVLAADEPTPPRDMVVLTVSGMIGKTNRGPLDAKARQSACVAKNRLQAGLRLRSHHAAVAAARNGDGAATGVGQARDLQRPLDPRGARLSRGGASQDNLRRRQRL